MSSAVTSFLTVPIADWVYQEPRKNPKNGLNVYLNSSSTNNSNPKIQLAKGRAPFGIQDGMEANARKNLEVNVESDELFKFLENVNNQNIDWVTSNCPKLFKRELDRGVVATLYRSLMSMPTNPSYKPLLRIKINSSGREPTRVFVVEKDETESTPMEFSHGTMADIVPGCLVLPIVEVGGLWFVSKGCGMTLVATDVLVWPIRARSTWSFVGFQGVQTAAQTDPEPDGTIVGIRSHNPSDSPPSTAANDNTSVTSGDGDMYN